MWTQHQDSPDQGGFLGVTVRTGRVPTAGEEERPEGPAPGCPLRLGRGVTKETGSLGRGGRTRAVPSVCHRGKDARCPIRCHFHNVPRRRRGQGTPGTRLGIAAGSTLPPRCLSGAGSCRGAEPSHSRRAPRSLQPFLRPPARGSAHWSQTTGHGRRPARAWRRRDRRERTAAPRRTGLPTPRS